MPTNKQKRGYVKARITKTLSSLVLKKENNSLTNTYLNNINELLKTNVSELDSLNSIVLESLSSDTEIEEELNGQLDYRLWVESTLAELTDHVQSETTVQPGAAVPPAPVVTDALRIRNQLKLPQLPLPSYGHKEGENLHRFLTGFETITNKYSLEPYEKFMLMRSKLSGDALVLIDSLSEAEQSYNTAKELLVEAFASPTTQKFEVVQRLLNINLPYKGDAYKFASEMRTIMDNFKELNIDTDTVMQYCFWQGMNESLKNNFVTITNCNKPTLDQLKKHLFEAIERYNLSNRKLPEKRVDPTISKSLPHKSVGMAVSVDYKSDSPTNYGKPCCLCVCDGIVSVSHPIHKCNKYVSPKDKSAKLRSMKVCEKCTKPGHKRPECKFRLMRPCDHCTGDHFSYLCPMYARPVAGKRGETRPATAAGNTVTVSADIFKLQSGRDSLLPTFSSYLPGGCKVRGMKDSGSQLNFISDELATRENLDIVEHSFDIVINGFNKSKSYNTKLVRFPMRFGDTVHEINAICVPELTLKLKLNGLSALVREFSVRGYELADIELASNKIDNIQFILGAEASYCIPENTVLFGKTPSSFSQTPLGVMLSGSIANMMRDISDLPARNVSEPKDTTVGKCHCATAVESDKADDNTTSNCEDSLYNCDIDGPRVSDVCEADQMVQNQSVYAGFSVIDENGLLNETELNKAVNDILNCDLDKENEKYLYYLKCEEESNNEFVDENKLLVKTTLDSISRDYDGRMIIPLMWNYRVCHLLGKNLSLCKQILSSNLKKLNKSEGSLSKVDAVFREQRELGVIELIPDLDAYLSEHPEACFIGHMPVFRPDKDSTKCRVVYLSNLCEKRAGKPLTVSHNQAIVPGPCLNKKLSTALLQLRFGKHLLTFDLVRAFLQIKIPEIDQNKLIFLWFKNIEQGDFSLVAYKCVRLPFGLRCSPTILMLGLYYMLVLQPENDPRKLELKKMIYDLFYVDNGAIATDDENFMVWAWSELERIFAPFGFALQQFSTNSSALKSSLQPEESKFPEVTKLLGLNWNTVNDTLETAKLNLDPSAVTKRQILSTIASNFDLYNFCGPLLNRARIFLHDLQLTKSLNWDDKLSQEQLKTWQNICTQVNSAPKITVNRYVGNKNSTYKLVAYTDSSNIIYGTVLFIVDTHTGDSSFLLAKNRIVNKNLETKSIPNLELQGIVLGTETLLDTLSQLTNEDCVCPINISELILYTDSVVCLSWLNSFSSKMDKMNNRNVFTKNRLDKIQKLCEKFPIKYRFCSGANNPADSITRPMSYKMLMKSSYFTCSHGDNAVAAEGVPEVEIPNPRTVRNNNVQAHINTVDEPRAAEVSGKPLLNITTFSSLRKLVAVYELVHKFIHKLKSKVKAKRTASNVEIANDHDIRRIAWHRIILEDQQTHFPEILEFFDQKNSKLSNIPELVKQCNVFRDEKGILRVKSKFRKWGGGESFPVLLDKNSWLTKLIILDIHKNLNHSGVYSVLNELCKSVFVKHRFSLVRKILKDCTHCRRFNRRPVALNQGMYRDFRVSPPTIAYRFLFLDYIGPYHVRRDGKKCKVYLLILTCLWSRSINLKVCLDLTVDEFLRAFQLHVLEYGVPEQCFSDLGTQIVAGANIMKNFVKDCVTQNYFAECGIKSPEFNQYFKGCNKLGGLVESCVKMVKRLIFGAIRNSVLNFRDFEFLVAHTIHLVNRRPIAFKECLRGDETDDSIPSPITPEILIKGHELPSVNLIPDLQDDSELGSDPLWSENYDPVDYIRKSHSSLVTARSRLIEHYNSEFVKSLVDQATNSKDRFKPVENTCLSVGDLVLIKDSFTKPANYPMGLVKKVFSNADNIVTDALIYKGSGVEVKRHVTSLIPLLARRETSSHCDPDSQEIADPADTDSGGREPRIRRKAAIQSESQTRALVKDGSV